MGKNKKTRWRTFSFNGSKEDETHIADGKLNDIDIKYSSSETPHKYSQILGDHQTNYISSIGNRTTSSSFIHNSNKTRNGYNNKENYYNQRSAAKNNILSSKATFGSQRSHKYPINASSLKDKPEQNGLSDHKDVQKTEPIKFNEDEYTRITTPRQDVLFKKGYLSRMNSNNNKTASPQAVTTTTDSTAPNSTITTNSDQESNVSTLSPATTPSTMDYGQVDGMEYAAPVYYPGYYDENGLVVIPMYNGYNYYPNSSAPSPLYLMPCTYQYDSFFMNPNTEVPTGDDSATEKSEQQLQEEQQQQDDENEESSDKSESLMKTTDSSTAEEQNGARMSSEDATTNNSQREETESDEKSGKQEPNENMQSDQSSKQFYQFYPNEFGGYVYPTYSNGFYNGLYYYPQGMPTNRPSKLRRRKRFLSARNSHPRSTETTTDYSDDDAAAGNSTYTYKRYNPRHHNGYFYHHNHHHNHNNFNQYHYNSKYHYNKMNVDKNANETPSNLNVDVPEFCPRVQSKSEERDVMQANEQESNKHDVPAAKVNNDLQNQHVAPKATRSEMPINNKINNNNNIKTSHTPKPSNTARPLSKKDIIEGIKSMEQQNINLVSTSKTIQSITNTKKDEDEWNVIRNGKKIKVQRDADDVTIDSEDKVVSEVTPQNTVVAAVAEIKPTSQEKSIKKTTNQQTKPVVQAPNSQKSKKSKGKNKKKKNHFTGKQDGFEIIEPEFGNNSDDSANKKGDEATEEDVEDECDEEPLENVVNLDEEVKEVEVVLLKVLNAQSASSSNAEQDDAVIDISDEDICNRSTSIEIDLSIAQEIAAEIEKEDDKDDSGVEVPNDTEVFNDVNFFDNNHINIAELERDLMENLKILDDGIDIKSPIINPLYDFPITSAVQKWLHEKQNESFENLFRLENFKKLSELYDDCDNDVDDDKSDISDTSPVKSDTTDSDYASDIQVNKGSPASSNAKIITSKSSSNSKKIIAKESFCALM